ncbi:MAG: ribosomal RNA small subunit methyltransferase A [Deltaproteobacteria bacterium]|nr:MAG: ribosomal RNA small subunit methyltransferase A [Deltaproteobacteria bacterium]
MVRGAPAPDKALGQHFLSDPNILAKIVNASGVQPGEAVLEIGPGPGALTKALIGAGAHLTAIEADPRMVAHLNEELGGTLELIEGDALRTDYLALAEKAGGPMRLVANLPYNISGPLMALLLKERSAFKSMTLMFQREVAERIAAPPGGKERGKLSVMAQAFCKVKRVMRVPPGAFIPPPKVESAVIHLDILPEPVAPLEDEGMLWRAVAAGFGQRRKMLRNTLKPLLAGLPGEELFLEAGLKGTERAETLSVAEWIQLANVIAARELD